MEIAFFSVIILGLIAILLSWEIDLLKKHFLEEKKLQEDKIYKLSVFKDIAEKIAYTKNPEQVMNILLNSLRNFFPYSTASFMHIGQDSLVFKTHVEEPVSINYIEAIERQMISSLSHLVEKLPARIDKSLYGIPLNDPAAAGVKSTYSSSFHVPLIVKNKVMGLIYLSSKKSNVYKNMEDLYELIEIATSSLNNFTNALETEKFTFTDLLKSINDGILMIDDQSSLSYINDSAKKMLGLTSENIGFSDIGNAFVQNLDLALIINDVVVNNKPFSIKELKLNDSIVDIFINPIADNKVSIVLHDMTDYRKKEVSKEDLTNIMVHELRSPLTNIKDSAALIITSGDSLDENKKLKFLEIIHQQAKKVLGSIGSILDTAKLDAGKLTLQKTKGNIANLIKEEIATFMPQAERKNIFLSFDILHKPLPEISFDSVRIAQVIDNLLSNSLKFTQEHGRIKIEIDYRTIPPKLDGTSPMGKLLSLDKYIVVSVTDNGVGIAKEQQAHLFAKYTQAENTPEKLTKLGTGLGLYLVKGIVQSHGGLVWVKSAVGQGTTISFTLPAIDDSKTSFDDPKPSPSPLSNLARTVN